jgi:hypothetical protein
MSFFKRLFGTVGLPATTTPQATPDTLSQPTNLEYRRAQLKNQLEAARVAILDDPMKLAKLGRIYEAIEIINGDESINRELVTDYDPFESEDEVTSIPPNPVENNLPILMEIAARQPMQALAYLGGRLSSFDQANILEATDTPKRFQNESKVVLLLSKIALNIPPDNLVGFINQIPNNSLIFQNDVMRSVYTIAISQISESKDPQLVANVMHTIQDKIQTYINMNPSLVDEPTFNASFSTILTTLSKTNLGDKNYLRIFNDMNPRAVEGIPVMLPFAIKSPKPEIVSNPQASIKDNMVEHILQDSGIQLLDEPIRNNIRTCLSSLDYYRLTFLPMLIKRYGITNPLVVDFMLGQNQEKYIHVNKTGGEMQVHLGDSQRIIKAAHPAQAKIMEKAAELGPFFDKDHRKRLFVEPIIDTRQFDNQAIMTVPFCGINASWYEAMAKNGGTNNNYVYIQTAISEAINNYYNLLLQNGISHNDLATHNLAVRFVKRSSIRKNDALLNLNSIESFDPEHSTVDPQVYLANPNVYDIVISIIDFDKAIDVAPPNNDTLSQPDRRASTAPQRFPTPNPNVSPADALEQIANQPIIIAKPDALSNIQKASLPEGEIDATTLAGSIATLGMGHPFVQSRLPNILTRLSPDDLYTMLINNPNIATNSIVPFGALSPEMLVNLHAQGITIPEGLLPKTENQKQIQTTLAAVGGQAMQKIGEFAGRFGNASIDFADNAYEFLANSPKIRKEIGYAITAGLIMSIPGLADKLPKDLLSNPQYIESLQQAMTLLPDNPLMTYAMTRLWKQEAKLSWTALRLFGKAFSSITNPGDIQELVKQHNTPTQKPDGGFSQYQETQAPISDLQQFFGWLFTREENTQLSPEFAIAPQVDTITQVITNPVEIPIATAVPETQQATQTVTAQVAEVAFDRSLVPASANVATAEGLSPQEAQRLAELQAEAELRQMLKDGALTAWQFSKILQKAAGTTATAIVTGIQATQQDIDTLAGRVASTMTPPQQSYARVPVRS